MITYATEQLADKALKAATERGREVFCPLIRQQCRKDCASYVPPRKIRAGTGTKWKPTWYIVPATCINAVVSGTISLDQ